MQQLRWNARREPSAKGSEASRSAAIWSDPETRFPAVPDRRNGRAGDRYTAPARQLRGFETAAGSAKGWADYLGFRIAGEALAA